MSRSNNTELKNPAQKFFQWDGTNGGFNWFDKTRGENGERVHISLPFDFLVLDTLSTVKGFDDASQSGYWSNEVRNVGKDELVIRSKYGIQAKGIYGEIIKNCTGARYCQSVYIAYLEGTQWVIGNLQLVGSALSAWIEFRKKNNVFSGKIVIAKMLDGKKGATKYKIPVYSQEEVMDEMDNIAKELDRELQVYLDAYLQTKKSSEPEHRDTQPESDIPLPNDKDLSEDDRSLPF